MERRPCEARLAAARARPVPLDRRAGGCRTSSPSSCWRPCGRLRTRGAMETADRGLMLCRQVWRYGIATGRVSSRHHGRPQGRAVAVPGNALRRDHRSCATRRAACARSAPTGGPIVRAALQLAPLLFQRPGELRAAAWTEMDLDGALWTIPAARMKRGKEGKENGDPHAGPVAETGRGDTARTCIRIPGMARWSFRASASHERPISENSVRTAVDFH